MNAYLTGIEGMPKLLDCCGDDPMQYFKKQTYADSFQKMYQQHIVTFDAIEQGYNTVIDKEQFLTNMAEALAKYGTEKYSACSKKSQKERCLMDMNLVMAVFVLPMILEFHGNSSKPLSEKVIAAWKQEFPKSSLQAAEYTYIETGFHKKFCYITTAVCENFGKPDDCYELRTLRSYRDEYLACAPGGQDMIRKYYDVAPAIVKHINQQPQRNEIYESIWTEYLSPCIQMIEKNQLDECRVLYEDMVDTLAEKYFLS